MHPTQIFKLVLGMLVAVLALHWLAERLRLPPSAALLVGGGALAFIPGVPAVSLDPELVLVLFLPPLLVDGAWHTELVRFRRHIAGILSLAVGAVGGATDPDCPMTLRGSMYQRLILIIYRAGLFTNNESGRYSVTSKHRFFADFLVSNKPHLYCYAYKTLAKPFSPRCRN